MQLTPHYGDDPIISLDGDPASIAAPTVRQRRRLVDLLSGFDATQWAHPTRCAGWSVRDVVVHLESTNTFWNFSIASGLAGEPTRFLAGFDPVASPAELVANAGEPEPAALLERFASSTAALCDRLESLDDADWERLAEAPPGHLSVSALAHHALWDSWVHERDIVLPLGLEPAVEPDEVAATLRYAAALSPAFAVSLDRSPGGVLVVEAVEPDVVLTVEVGDRVVVRSGRAPHADLDLAGPAVELVEALSIRTPLRQTVPSEAAWFLGGLATIFDGPISG